VRFLLEKGARTNITDAGGRKPIDLVAADAKSPGATQIRGLLEKLPLAR
jgi:hypothetical protein